MTWENRIVFEVSSAEPDAEVPVWVDLSLRILDDLQAVRLQIGRQNDLDQSEPARVDLLLNNADDALTFGNLSSPYAAWWGPGRKCRLRDTVSGARLTLFTGYIEVPDEAVITTGIEARVAISAVDRLGRLADSPQFVSTLTEHIRFSGGTALKAYWPLNDASGATTGASLVAGIGPLLQVVNYNDTPRQNQLQWGQRTGPIGDDASYVQMNPTAAVIAAGTGFPRIVRRDFNVPLNAGEVVAIAGWVYMPVGSVSAQVLVAHANGSADPTFQFTANVATGWTLLVSTSAGIVSPTLPATKTDSWQMFGGLLNVTSGAITFFVGDQTTTAALGGASTGTFQEVALDGENGYSFGSVQFYAGNPGTLTRAFFTDQYQMGLLGLDRQPTGDRIRTIARYAGLPNVDVANTIDTGASIMQRAELAGKDPLTAMREAETTEQGLLSTDGDGRLVFRDRRSLYNV